MDTLLVHFISPQPNSAVGETITVYGTVAAFRRSTFRKSGRGGASNSARVDHYQSNDCWFQDLDVHRNRANPNAVDATVRGTALAAFVDAGNSRRVGRHFDRCVEPK